MQQSRLKGEALRSHSLRKTHRPTSDFALVRLSGFQRRELPTYIAQLHAHFTVFTSVHCTRQTTVQHLVLRKVGSQLEAGSWKSDQLQLEMESMEFHKFLKAVHQWGSGTSIENVPFACSVARHIDVSKDPQAIQHPRRIFWLDVYWP